MLLEGPEKSSHTSEHCVTRAFSTGDGPECEYQGGSVALLLINVYVFVD